MRPEWLRFTAGTAAGREMMSLWWSTWRTNRTTRTGLAFRAQACGTSGSIATGMGTAAILAIISLMTLPLVNPAQMGCHTAAMSELAPTRRSFSRRNDPDKLLSPDVTALTLGSGQLSLGNERLTYN